MRYFKHVNTTSLDEASGLLRTNESKAKAMAGGTDLLGILKDKILPQYPETIVNLKTIEGLEYIVEDTDGLKVGAMAKLNNIADSPIIKEKYKSLSEAAYSVASPLIRNIATIGGNICQDVRCWYYRYPHQIGGRIVCARKGGESCNAMIGENRYHSIFGGTKVHMTPCTNKCPTNVDVPGYMSRLRADDIENACRIILENNPMPAVTSRVCAHFCQEACNRNGYDEKVGIGNAERFVGDYVLSHANKLMPAPDKETGKHVAIVGSGPAGLVAAFYLRRAGHRVTVYEKMDEAGGLLTYAIPSYRLPKEIVRNLVEALKNMGIKFKLKTEIGKDIKIENLSQNHDGVFIDTGAWKRPIIGIDGEELTKFGLEFLMEVKSWMKNKLGTDIVVIGGGNVAIDVAVTAKRQGALKVTMICLEKQEELPASKEEIERAMAEGIILMPSWGPSKILRKDGKIVGVELIHCKCVFDENMCFAPEYDENEKITVQADSILMAVGQQTDLSFLGEEFSLEVNRGRISVDKETQKTSLPGVFAGGDVTTGPSTVVMAVASGKKAAAAINEYLIPGFREQEKSRFTHAFLQFDRSSILKSKSIPLHERPIEERNLDNEDVLGMEWNEIKSEVKRCFNCGCLAVNPSDIATVLVSLDAKIKTNKREYSAEEFLTINPKVSNLIDQDELVIEIMIPKQSAKSKLSYDKFRVRESIDFAVVSVASVYEVNAGKIKSAKVVLGAVAPVPIRTAAVEEYLQGKEINQEVAEKAANLAVAGAIALDKNEYKIQTLKTLVKRSILNAQ